MDITNHQLRCFLTVARTLHFSSAAQELNLSPSALSEQIKALERRTGHTLFRRTSRRVQLTDHGERLLPLAHRAVDAHDDVLAWASTNDSSNLTIGLMVSSIGFREVLTTATRALPNVQWQVRQIGFEGCFQALTNNEVDCVFTAHMGTEPPLEFTCHELWSEPSVLVTPTGHELANRRSVSMTEIVTHELIAPRSTALESGSGQWLGGFGRLSIAHHAATFEEVLELCGAGLGVNVAAASARATHTHPGVVFVPIDDGPTVTTYLSHRTASAGSTLAQFVAAARDSGP